MVRSCLPRLLPVLRRRPRWRGVLWDRPRRRASCCTAVVLACRHHRHGWRDQPVRRAANLPRTVAPRQPAAATPQRATAGAMVHAEAAGRSWRPEWCVWAMGTCLTCIPAGGWAGSEAARSTAAAPGSGGLLLGAPPPAAFGGDLARPPSLTIDVLFSRLALPAAERTRQLSHVA